MVSFIASCAQWALIETLLVAQLSIMPGSRTFPFPALKRLLLQLLNMLQTGALNTLAIRWINRLAVIVLLLAVYTAGRDDGIRTLYSRPCQPLPDLIQ